MAQGKRAKKKKKPHIFKRLKNYLSKPGMFSKVLVLFCLGYTIRVIEWGIHQFEMSNTEASTIITVAVGFFGTELALLCLKRVFAKKDNKEAMDMCNDTSNMAD